MLAVAFDATVAAPHGPIHRAPFRARTSPPPVVGEKNYGRLLASSASRAQPHRSTVAEKPTVCATHVPGR